MLKKRTPLGTSDFRKLIQKNCYFVDKSLFIQEVEEGSEVLLFTRPRRFGKTLNLSMLRYFYDNKEDNSALFNGLKITEEPEIMEKQGKHPVIYLTFKDVKENTWAKCYKSISETLCNLMHSFKKIIYSDNMAEIDCECLKKIISRTADETDYAMSLKLLSQALHHYYHENVVILIDEYDTPIHEAYYKGFYNEMIDFMRVFLGSTLKDNDCLEKAVITGILRVSKESLFSGLNNLEVCTISDNIANDKFGFTQAEVEEIIKYYDDIFSLEDIKYWYDGYNFENAEMYNPWSILSSMYKKKLDRHWVNTAGNGLLRELCLKAGETVKQDIDILTQGGSFQKVIDDNIVFGDLGKDDNIIWSFLLHTGYLRYDNLFLEEDGGPTKADLRIPNNEVLTLYKQDIVKNWFTPPYNPKEITKITNNLLTGDISVFGQEFQEYCLDAVSYYDVAGDAPEQHYHNIVLGILFCLKGICHIKSNRESGLGRYDIMLYPKDRSHLHRGVVFEFKKVNTEKKQTFEWAIADAMSQIEDNKYNQELQSLGFKDIVNIIMVFAGKDVRVEVVRSEG